MVDHPQTFCVHHGMSPKLHTLNDMDALARFVITGLVAGSMVMTVLTRLTTRNELAEDEAPLSDLLFSEPQDSPCWVPNEDLLGYLWGPGPKAAIGLGVDHDLECATCSHRTCQTSPSGGTATTGSSSL
jgi:hypothetical protein